VKEDEERQNEKRGRRLAHGQLLGDSVHRFQQLDKAVEAKPVALVDGGGTFL